MVDTKMLKKRVYIFILFSSLFILGVVLRLYNLANVEGRSPDEQIYTYQAGIISQEGAKGIKLLVDEYNANDKLWIYPPPVRAGYLLPLGFVMRMTNNTDVKVGARVSCFFSIVSLLFLIALGLRFFNRWIALYGLLFMSVSPMELAIARRTWQDAMLGCMGLMLVYFCCEITRASRKVVWYVLFILAGSYCLLIKESGAVIYGLCMAWLLWVLLIKEKSLFKGAVLVCLGALGALAGALFLSHLSGGIPNIIKVLAHVKEAMPNNLYAIEYQSGPWYNFLEGFWILTPVNAVLCIIGVAAFFLVKELFPKFTPPIPDKERPAVSGVIFFMTAFMAVAAATPYCQNLRYVSALFVPFYLIGGLGLWSIVSFTRSRLRSFSFCIVTVFIIAGIIAAAAGDYQRFQKIFVERKILDTSARLLREASR